MYLRNYLDELHDFAKELNDERYDEDIADEEEARFGRRPPRYICSLMREKREKHDNQIEYLLSMIGRSNKT